MQNLLSVEAAAELLSLSRWTIRVYEREKKIPSVRIGRRVLFRPEDLERFVQERTGAATEPAKVQ